MEGLAHYVRIGLWWGFLFLGILGTLDALSVGNLALGAVLLGMMHLSVLLGRLLHLLASPVPSEAVAEPASEEGA